MEVSAELDKEDALVTLAACLACNAHLLEQQMYPALTLLDQ